jgi:hypothetical protein
MAHPKSLASKFVLTLFLLILTALPVYAQGSDYRLGISKTFGYANGGDIRGTFMVYVSGPAEGIKSVEYTIDGKQLGTATSSPFSLTFQTTSFSDGNHELSASVELTDGRKVTAPARTFNFASAADESSGMLRIVVPILGLVVGVVLVGVALQVFVFRKKFANMPPGTARNYGFRGGTICPRCHRPHAIHIWAINLPLSRLDRCDFCGKWAFVRAASMNELRAAEQQELESFENKTPVMEKSQEEKLREMLDKSKYSDQ